MSNENEIRIVIGSKRYAGNTDKDVWLQPPLIGDRRELIEGDRSILVNQQTLFETERQESDKFRLAGKITNVFDNTVTGKTSYTPFKNNLYYTNAISNATNNSNFWEGNPQFDEFSIQRFSGITGHVPFVPKSASTYNWSFYVSYAFSSTTAQTMSYTDEKFGVTNGGFLAGDGIPYVLTTSKFNGKSLVYFYCGTNHNLQIGQYVELSTPINNKTIFQVYSLGDGTIDSENKVFTIYDLKYPTLDIQTGVFGNLKRITEPANSAETKSIYYVRLHKIIKNSEQCNISKAGFENNPFAIDKKLEYSALTPNQVQRVSVKNNAQTFSFTFDKDVKIAGYIDNNGKPITELFLTIINRGYMGWFNKPFVNQNGLQTAIDIGWNFNFLENSVDTWWNHNNSLNKDNIPTNSYSLNGQTFYYNEILNQGDVILGDFCEYNYMEQREYVLSRAIHKYSFNDILFQTTGNQNYPDGYLYNPHHSIPIRAFSDYIENGTKDTVDNIPGYSWFSEYNNKWYWRDLYTYGYIDSDGIGVNNPFINGAHYPFLNCIFLQYPIQRNNNVFSNEYQQITNDDCE
jgi:hypothetical protein